MVIKPDKLDHCLTEFLKLITGKRRLREAKPLPPPKYVYEPPERYLLPSEEKTKKKKRKKRKKGPIKTIALTKLGFEAYRKPYKCVRQCVQPETATIRYQEFYCYPPLHCNALKYHPPVGRPLQCTCKICDQTCQKGCGCVPECVRVREVRNHVSHLQAPCDLEPITVCIPVPPRKPPQRVCNTCILELRVDENFNILNDKAVRKHIHKEDKKFQDIKKKFEIEEFNRLKKIGRLCPTLHMPQKDIPIKFAEGDTVFRIKRVKGEEPYITFAKYKRLAGIVKKKKVETEEDIKKKGPSMKHKLKKCMYDSATSLKKALIRSKKRCDKKVEKMKKDVDKLNKKTDN